MVVISDSGPLISLAKIGKFYVLKKIFKEIIIPESVYMEVVEQGKGRPGEKELRDALGKWIQKKKVSDLLAVQLLLSELKNGEAESMVLAKEIKGDLLLLDDKIARDIAEISGLTIKGTLGVLLIAYNMGIIKNLKKAVDDLQKKGFYLKEEIYQRILEKVR